jgi:hypothetical protein
MSHANDPLLEPPPQGPAAGKRWRTLAFATLALGLVLLPLAFWLRERWSVPVYAQAAVDPASTTGVLRLSLYGGYGSDEDETALRLVTTYVRGPHYQGMEDNDMRGFLDGYFLYGWNQASVEHIRVGRRNRMPALGEYELFRPLLRWSGIELAPGARVLEARLTLEVEEGPPGELEVLLYEVKKEWNPGEGGTLKDSTSPPRRGEVWWKDVAYQEEPWGLPGAGFCSDDAPQADLGAMPLAIARYRPGEREVVFASLELTEYASRRVLEKKPLLFLLKLCDPLEDTVGTVLSFYSANQGDYRNTRRRPRLTLEWESPREKARIEERVRLEHGRTYLFPRLEASGAAFLAASFIADPGSEQPLVELRGGRGEEVSAWREATLPFAAEWDWVEARLTAARDPHPLGSRFESSFRDTWVVTRPPEKQRVIWTFISPDGERHTVAAAYAGGYTWEVSFPAAQLGRWRYSWTHGFTKAGFQSAEGVFDVVAGGRENVKLHLEGLLERIRDSSLSARSRLARFGQEFARLQRAALQHETPDSFRSEAGLELQALLRRIRCELSGKVIGAHRKPFPAKRKW